MAPSGSVPRGDPRGDRWATLPDIRCSCYKFGADLEGVPATLCSHSTPGGPSVRDPPESPHLEGSALPEAGLSPRPDSASRKRNDDSLERSRLVQRDVPKPGERRDTLRSAFWLRILARQASAVRRVRL